MIRDFDIEPVYINTEIESLVIKERVMLDPYGEMKRTHYVSLHNGKEYPFYEKMEAELVFVLIVVNAMVIGLIMIGCGSDYV